MERILDCELLQQSLFISTGEEGSVFFASMAARFAFFIYNKRDSGKAGREAYWL